MASSQKTSPEVSGEIAKFRHFNRMYTRYIGTLNEGLLNSDYSLAEARVLYELANRTGPKASEIAEGLGMDPGYLSRLLGKFERDGLVEKKASEEDGRFAELTLTSRGKTAFKKLNALSEEQAHTALESLPPTARMELIDCMQTIERILMKVDRSRIPYVLRPHRVGDMGWIVHREGLGYLTRSSTAGMKHSKHWRRISCLILSPTSSLAGNGAGSRKSMARMWGMCFSSNIRANRARRSFACCLSNQAREVWVLAML